MGSGRTETVEDAAQCGTRSLRKRKNRINGRSEDEVSKTMHEVLRMAKTCKKVLVFSGSGLSATSGMSTFTTPGGLYDRARKRFRLSDGKKLFHYSFFHKHRMDCMAFLADIYHEALHARPSKGHEALAQLWAMGKLQRHYTMNIDGLCEAVGMDTWQPMPMDTPADAADGDDGIDMEYPRGAAASTVEMHGNIRQLVCAECQCWAYMDTSKSRQIRRKQVVKCGICGKGEGLRPRVMLYDDDEGDSITPEDVWDIMKDDVAAADMILWVGISFEQSASTTYFRKVRSFLNEQNRTDKVFQAILNPSEEAHWNVVSSCSNLDELKVFQVRTTGDEFLPSLVDTYNSDDATQHSPP
uniref:Deacetylase sirtuin-type domain-containing protein n=1 Tax=Tetraselmis chuii TaxID=63592 RepID=A0A7S1XCA0_9CHLO|mmetsp:Transcript_8330/g.15033  ORF Transcript_8330/g.15033 Transcript_8330/m.15033 type:complete len:355 (+) Transcript_8330:132-1196(+)